MAVRITKAGDIKRTVTISIIMDGQRAELDGRVLSARQIEEIDRMYAMPEPPRYQDKEGAWKVDDTDPAYRAKGEAAIMQRMHARACAILGPGFFGTDALSEQLPILMDAFTPDQITEIVRQSRTSSIVERADVEAAKNELLPFAATSAAAATSP